MSNGPYESLGTSDSLLLWRSALSITGHIASLVRRVSQSRLQQNMTLQFPAPSSLPRPSLPPRVTSFYGEPLIIWYLFKPYNRNGNGLYLTHVKIGSKRQRNLLGSVWGVGASDSDMTGFKACIPNRKAVLRLCMWVFVRVKGQSQCWKRSSLTHHGEEGFHQRGVILIVLCYT